MSDKKPTKKELQIEGRKELFAEKYSKEIKWLSTNELASKDNFLSDMLKVLQSGGREFTEKMEKAVHKSMRSPKFDMIKSIKLREQYGPLMKKVEMIYEIVNKLDEDKDEYYKSTYSALPFVTSIKTQLERNMFLSEKQLGALNKVFVKYNKRLNKLLEEQKKESK